MGKTNQEEILYRRAMRYQEVELCSIGGLGLYLMTRFQVTNELDHIDFSDNKTWFNRKLLKAMTGGADNNHQNELSMTTSKYNKKMKAACKACNIESQIWLHLDVNVRWH